MCYFVLFDCFVLVVFFFFSKFVVAMHRLAKPKGTVYKLFMMYTLYMFTILLDMLSFVQELYYPDYDLTTHRFIFTAFILDWFFFTAFFTGLLMLDNKFSKKETKKES